MRRTCTCERAYWCREAKASRDGGSFGAAAYFKPVRAIESSGIPRGANLHRRRDRTRGTGQLADGERTLARLLQRRDVDGELVRIVVAPRDARPLMHGR